MSFVIAAPETLVRAASDLANEHRVDAGGRQRRGIGPDDGTSGSRC